MRGKVVSFIKKETVLVVAVILAVLSMFFVYPSEVYNDYIDYRVLGILLTLMYIMQGLSVNGFFDAVGEKLLSHTKKVWQLLFVLVFLCFFFAMLITNDVALITFVPFAIVLLKKSNNRHLMIYVIVLQTLAANLGSMLTPIGNPQNLYLFQLSGYGIGEFLTVMFPYTLVAGILLVISILFVRGKGQNISYEREPRERIKGNKRRKIIIYLILFVCAVLVVARIFPWQYVLLATALILFTFDKKVLVQVDYCLLLTFVAFFIFTGNLSHISGISEALQGIVKGNEVMVSVGLSQVISNVPATLMLTRFSENYKALMVGINLGGMGTLIASMASLISYKLYAAEETRKGKYILCFTGMNVLFFLVLAGCFFVLKSI